MIDRKLICIIFFITILTACTTPKTNMTSIHANTSSSHQMDVDEVSASINPVAANYNLQLGMAYLQRGELQQAKRKLLTALQQAPKSPTVNDAMAFLQERTGNIKLAQHYYRAAIQLAPAKGAQLNNYGTFLCRRGRYNEAIKYFLMATQDQNYVNSAQAYENAGLCATGIPNNKVAKKYFLTALAQDPKRTTSLLALAQMAYQQNQLNTAQTYLQRFNKFSRPTASSTWLAYQLAEKLGQRTKLARYALLLRTRFARSPEFQKFKISKRAAIPAKAGIATSMRVKHG